MLPLTVSGASTIETIRTNKRMKKDTRQKQNTNNHGNDRHSVHIEFSYPAAATVAIAGTFNDWRPEATPMISTGEGRWLKDLVLPSGRYEYLFVVDGKWVTDPFAPATVPNPFGGMNSVITVPRNRPASKKEALGA